MATAQSEHEAYRFCIAIQDAVGPNSRADTTSEFSARNLVAHKPAFGWTTGYSNAPAGTFAFAVNEHAGIEAGQEDIRAHFVRNGRDVTAEEWLDNLLPLNRAAEMDLLKAYQRAGTFREASELRRRTERFLPTPALQAAEVA